MQNPIIKIVSLLIASIGLSVYSQAAETGEQTYQQACAACHASGIAGAPKFGVKDDWTERLKKGKTELYQSSINGLGAMPAKGGRVDLSDETVIAAVDFMLEALDKEQESKSDEKSSQVVAPVVLSAAQEQGKELAFERNKGNCLACHQIDDGELPGNSGPPLNNMKVRFPDKSVLRAQIADATKSNPETVMPPYGRNAILNEEELDMVTDYIHAL